MQNNITLQVVFTKAVTTVDGGWRISFDCLESESEKIAKLASLRDQGLHIAIFTDQYLADMKQNTKQ